MSAEMAAVQFGTLIGGVIMGYALGRLSAKPRALTLRQQERAASGAEPIPYSPSNVAQPARHPHYDDAFFRVRP